MARTEGPNDTWIIDKVVNDISEMGYSNQRIILKCDQEPAIVRVQEDIMSKRPLTVPRHSQVGESAANSEVEGAHRRIFAQVRTLKDAVEAKTKIQIDTKHPVFEWLVEWSACSLTRFAIRKNGKTPYQMVTGRRSTVPIAELGESVLYMPLKTTRVNMSKVEPRLRYGIWLGLRTRCNSSLIWDPGRRSQGEDYPTITG